MLPNIVQTLVYNSRLPGLNGRWIDLMHPMSENYFSTVAVRLVQLFRNIVTTSPTLDQHLTDRHSRQSVMISAWAVELSLKRI